MTKKELQEQWLIEQCKATQAEGGTEPEIDLRYGLAKEFNIKLEWAYQLLRDICEKNPHLHREKVPVYYGSGENEYMRMEYEITWREKY